MTLRGPDTGLAHPRRGRTVPRSIAAV